MTRVVLLAGTGRSGSTLLANLLGEVPGWFSAGEVRFLWERGLREGRQCGCGQPVASCPVWHGVLEQLRAEGRQLVADPEAMVGRLARSQQLRHLPEALVAPGRYRRRLGEVPGELGALYDAIAEVSGSDVVVDSSKLPLYGALLANTPGVDLTVVHLVRSPYAAAYSWTSAKALDDGAAKAVMEQRGAAKSSVLWSVWNAATERLFRRGSYVRVRYEDLVADPRGTLGRVLATVGVHDELAFLDGTTATLSPNHTVAGNPDRLHAGPVTVRPDDRWVTQLPAGQRRVVRGLTTPLARHYGYGRDGVLVA